MAKNQKKTLQATYDAAYRQLLPIMRPKALGGCTPRLAWL